MPEAVRARDELEAAMTKPEVKQAQKLSEHWFGKMSSTARKAKKKNIEGSGLGGPLPSYSVGELPDTNSAHASIIGRR